AHGNHKNHVDFNSFIDTDLKSVMEKAHLYISDQNPADIDLTSLKPTISLKVKITPTIELVLQKFAKKYSPISCKWYYY
ncbi:hypothetical protein BDQ12DRAFT_597190, partial [Crucibulum laeve]